MQYTIQDIINAELTNRLKNYRSIIASGSPEEVAESNRRYLCLQTALHIAGGTQTLPGGVITKMPMEEVRAELLRWMKEIQKNSTVKTMHHDGRVVALLSEFLESTKPAAPAPVQTTLL